MHSTLYNEHVKQSDSVIVYIVDIHTYTHREASMLEQSFFKGKLLIIISTHMM